MRGKAWYTRTNNGLGITKHKRNERRSGGAGKAELAELTTVYCRYCLSAAAAAAAPGTGCIAPVQCSSDNVASRRVASGNGTVTQETRQ